VWAKDRYHRILSLLSVRGQVSNDLLIQELQVSRETIRRDILELEGAGQLKRVHGGVVSTATSPEPPFKTRVVASAAEKRRIALAAAALIQPGMLCAIDTGTTTLAFAEALAGIPNVSVVTNSFDVAATIRAAQANATIILLGGNFGVDAPGTFGKLAVSQMQQFLPDMAILSPVALDADYGATSYDLPEAELARAMIDRATKLMLLADHTKLGEMSRVGLCGCDEIDILVTDRRADPADLSALKSKGVGQIVSA
jgi:DeoR family transcriptional regulator, fructose operon transcriptional repressor